MLDGRSDLWSVGCVLYELVTGRPPFQAATIADRLDNIEQHEADWSRFEQGPGLEALRLVIARALRVRPENRFAEAPAMEVALGAALPQLTRR